MNRTTAQRLIPFAVLPLLVATSHAQAGLPPTAPTAGAQQPSVSQLPSAQLHGNETAADPADIHIAWDGHLLQLSGGGATLQDVFRRIATETRVRVYGQVPGDRVYGNYGPAPLAVVIAALTDGLPVNVLFVDSTGTQGPQLTLTARNGAASPPDTSAQQQAYEPPQSTPPTPHRNQPTFGNGPATSAIGNAPPTVNQNATPTSSNTAADTGNPTSPTGVKTPQEIFEQLQRLRAAAAANH